ncbi:hypothetical protein YC2023_049407 [Brassica napus]
MEDEITLNTRIEITFKYRQNTRLTKLIFVIKHADLEVEMMVMKKMKYHSFRYHNEWYNVFCYIIFFWYTFEIFPVPHIFS